MAQKEVNYEEIYHQTLSVIPISFSEFTMGFVGGWLAPTIKKLLDNSVDGMPASTEDCSWIASLNEIGRMFGSMISIMFMDTLGRVFLLRAGAAITSLTWLLIIFTRSIVMLMVARFGVGIGSGICHVLTSLYLGENCSPRIRSISSCVILATYYFGVLSSFILGTYLSYTVVTYISAAVSLVSLLSCFLLVESPQSLAIRGKYEKAERNLMWLRGTDNKDDIHDECENIKSNIASEKIKKSSIKKLLSSKANRKSMLIVLVLAVCLPASGSRPLSSYISVIFPSSTASVSSDQFTILYGVVQLLSAVICSLIINRFNRRTLTLITTSVFVICHLCIAFLCYADRNAATIITNPLIVFLLIGIYLCFSVVLNAVFYMLRSEMFPLSIKPFGSGVCIIAQATMGFTIIKVFFIVGQAYGMFVNFIVYAVVAALTFLFTVFVLPETRGKTLIEIQKILEK